MAPIQNLNLKLIVTHIANGTFGEKLCRICLMPLSDLYENIFTKVCTINEECCVANILKELCDMEFSDTEHYNVCSNCFIEAFNAYRFYLNVKRNNEVLHFYTDTLQWNLNTIDILDTENHESLYVSLPAVLPDIPFVDGNIEKVFIKRDYDEKFIQTSNKERPINCTLEKNVETEKKELKTEGESEDDDDLIIIMNENGEPTFYRMQPGGSFIEIEYDERCRKAYKVITEEMPRKKSRKRGPMSWKHCSLCPTSYRFIAKLRDHMWAEHEIELFTCKICGVLIEGKQEYDFHINTHTNDYECNICGTVFRKRNTMVTHLQFHEKMRGKTIKSYDYVCVFCGAICRDKEKFKNHLEKHNTKEYTCYYCGRMYKKEVGFNNHIKKHEMYEIKKQQAIKTGKAKPEPKNAEVKRDFTCELCGRSFLGQRALLWHGRLHTNERPYTCDICGRGFVSVNRRNQHTLCAHTAPSRRCPLCPALFHMRSMVNSHIKKVHLKRHKRRTRTVRQQNVSWHTEPVPIQELSVAIQNDILELQAANNNTRNYYMSSAELPDDGDVCGSRLSRGTHHRVQQRSVAVHLKRHKRRTRTVRQQNVSWHTEPVPIQELSVAIQNDILELQAANNNTRNYILECE